MSRKKKREDVRPAAKPLSSAYAGLAKMDPTAKTRKQVILDAAIKKNINLGIIAQKSGISFGLLKSFMDGLINLPDEKAEKLASTLGIPVEEIMTVTPGSADQSIRDAAQLQSAKPGDKKTGNPAEQDGQEKNKADFFDAFASALDAMEDPEDDADGETGGSEAEDSAASEEKKKSEAFMGALDAVVSNAGQKREGKSAQDFSKGADKFGAGAVRRMRDAAYCEVPRGDGTTKRDNAAAARTAEFLDVFSDIVDAPKALAESPVPGAENPVENAGGSAGSLCDEPVDEFDEFVNALLGEGGDTRETEKDAGAAYVPSCEEVDAVLTLCNEEGLRKILGLVVGRLIGGGDGSTVSASSAIVCLLNMYDNKMLSELYPKMWNVLMDPASRKGGV